MAISTYTHEMADKICVLISNGIGLRAICRQEGFPGRQTVLDWLNSEGEQFAQFRAKYTRAREAQADYLDEEMQDVADSATPEDVQVAKLRVGTMQWRAAKLAPKKYGEKSAVEVTGQVGVTNLFAKQAALREKLADDAKKIEATENGD